MCFTHVRSCSSAHKFSEEEPLIVSRLDSGINPRVAFLLCHVSSLLYVIIDAIPGFCAGNAVRKSEVASALLTHWHLEIFSGGAGSRSVFFKKPDVLLFFHYYRAALETFIVIAAMTHDTWEADSSAVYEMETEEGHLWWL